MENTAHEHQPAALAAAVTELMFATKIRSTAEELGVSLYITKSAGELRKILDLHKLQCVIVDMSVEGNWAVEAIHIAKSHRTHPKVLAYCSHVQQHTARTAVEAGADAVWPRSRFSKELPHVLSDPGAVLG